MVEAICIREVVATAVNAADLSPGGRAVDVLGALGAAAHNRYFDADSGRMQARLSAVGTAEINPRKRLASLLERAKYGLDRSTIQPAIYHFAAYLRDRREYANWRIGNGNALVIRFSGRVVFEWLHDRCAQCGGGGQIAVGPIGERNTRTKICSLCNGRGAARIDHHARAQLLGVNNAIYEKHWQDRFSQAHVWLAAIEGSNIAPLRSQLKRGTLATVSE
jgi:hypothetical protein